MDLRNDQNVSFRTGCFLMASLSVARGASFLVSKYLLGDMAPFNLLGMRFLISFVFLFLLFSRKVIADVRKDPRILGASLLLGVVYFLCMAAELTGLKYTTTATCSFLENSAIVIVPVAEAVLRRRMPAPVILVSAAATFLGIGLIVFNNAGTGASLSGGSLAGTFLCILAALTYAAAILITDRVADACDPLTFGVLYVGVMGVLGTAVSFAVETPHLPQNGTQWALLLILAVVCTAFGFAMQPVAQKPLTPESAGIIGALNPLTTAVMGWLLMGDVLGPAGAAGAVLILTGILLPNTKRFRAR